MPQINDRTYSVPVQWDKRNDNKGLVTFSLKVSAKDMHDAMFLQLLHDHHLFLALKYEGITVKIGECTLKGVAFVGETGISKYSFLTHLSTWTVTSEQQLDFEERLMTLVFIDMASDTIAYDGKNAVKDVDEEEQEQFALNL